MLIYTSIGDLCENLGETDALAWEIFSFGFRPWLKNVACLSSLLENSLHLLNYCIYFILSNFRCPLLVEGLPLGLLLPDT